MAHSSDLHRSFSPSFLRLILVLVGVFLVGYTLRLPLFWRFKGDLRAQSSCPLCDCDCSSDSVFPLPSGFLNRSSADCSDNDPEMNEEGKKDIITLLSEEITLQNTVANDSVEHTKSLSWMQRKLRHTIKRIRKMQFRDGDLRRKERRHKQH